MLQTLMEKMQALVEHVRRRRVYMIDTKRPRGISLAKIMSLVLLVVVINFAAGHIRSSAPDQKPVSTSIKPAATVPVVAAKPVADTLQAIVDSWAAKQPQPPAVVVRQLTGGSRTASHNQAIGFVPASTYKLYAAYAMLHGVDQGTYSLATKLKDGKTLQTDLKSMITVSDNAAGRTLGFAYGWKNMNTLLAANGMSHSNMYNYVPPSTAPVGEKSTTAEDLATFLTKLHNGTLLSKSSSDLLLSYMKQQVHRERVPAGVPSGVTVADKPGWVTGADDDGQTQVENDAAIVYGPKSTYILVVMTKGTATKPLADLSTQVYDYLQS